MVSSSLRRLAVCAIVVASLLLGVGTEAWASFPARLGSHPVTGTVTSLTPDGVMVTTSEGTFSVPADVATFKVAGKRVKPGDLAVGTRVEVRYKTLRGTVLGVEGSRVSFQRDKDSIPLGLPLSYAKHSKVYVYLPKGDIVRVPIDQALAMQATPNVVVLGPDVPEAYSGYRDTYPWYGPSFGYGRWGGHGGFWSGWGWGWGPRWRR